MGRDLQDDVGRTLQGICSWKVGETDQRLGLLQVHGELHISTSLVHSGESKSDTEDL